MNRVVDILSLVAVTGLVLVLVRPGSQGPALVDAISNGWIGSLVTVTGSGVPRGYVPTAWSAAGTHPQAA